MALEIVRQLTLIYYQKHIVIFFLLCYHELNKQIGKLNTFGR